jgi:hypothetical protein
MKWETFCKRCPKKHRALIDDILEYYESIDSYPISVEVLHKEREYLEVKVQYTRKQLGLF